MKNARVKCYLKLLYLKGMLWIYAASQNVSLRTNVRIIIILANE